MCSDEMHNDKSAVITVPITVKERSGVNIKNAVVSNGVPLPLGKIFSADRLSLKARDGRLVKAGFTPLQKWQDGSWRFVLVSFLTDLAAGQSAEFDLVIGENRVQEDLVELEEDGNGYTVNTGKIRFRVNKRNFNVIDRLWLTDGCDSCAEEKPVIVSHDRGIIARIDGEEFKSCLGSVISSSVERHDEAHVVIRTEGKLGNGTMEKLDYKLWIKAYAGSSEVDLQFNIAKKEGDSWEHSYDVSAITVDLPFCPDGKMQFAFGGKNGLYEGSLVEYACLYQKNSDEYDFIRDGSVVETVKCGKSDKNRDIGWVDIKNETVGMGAAYRWFWQTNPSALRADAGGNLSVQVWAEMHEPYRFYTGVAKTTDIRLYFHRGDEPAKLVGDRLKAFQLPVMAQCPTSWYCQETRAVDPRLLDMNKDNWPESEHEMLEFYNRVFDDVFHSMLAERDGSQFYAPGEDGYGFMNFGDGYEMSGIYITPKHAGITWWSNNYYDHPYVCMLHYYRTGELKYLDYALECEYHLMDIDTASYDPENLIPGEYKTCPSVAHIKHYMKPVKDENGEIIDFKPGGQGGHWHFQGVEGLFQAYYLTGCTQALERGLEAAEFAMQKHTMNMDSQTRTIGHTLNGLAAAYCHTWDQRYLERMNWVWEQVRELALKERHDPKVENPYRVEFKPYIYVRGNWPFQTGIVLGGVYKYRPWSPFVEGELGIDNISRNTLAYEIRGRKTESGFNSGWREEESRWNYASDIMTASGSWLHPLFPEENFLDVMKKAAVHNLKTRFADRCKTFSQSFKFQWLTQFELAKPEVRERLFVSFSAFPLKVRAGEKVTFNNQSIGACECRWDFGDGQSYRSARVNVEHRYEKPGVYTVKLEAWDRSGNTEIFTIRDYIEVVP